MGTLVLFYEFVICDRVFTSSIQNQCNEMTVAVKNWSSSYKNKVKTRKYEKQVQDLANLLKQEDYQEFFNSKLVEQARDLFMQQKPHKRALAENNLRYVEIFLHLH